MIQIADNMGNVAEAEDSAGAAAAVQTLLEDNPGRVSTVVVTVATTQEALEAQFQSIVDQTNEQLWGKKE